MSKVQGKNGRSVVVSIRIAEADRDALLRNASRAGEVGLSDYLRLLILRDVRNVPDERLLKTYGHLLRLTSTAIEQEADPKVCAKLQEICRRAGAVLLGSDGS